MHTIYSQVLPITQQYHIVNYQIYLTHHLLSYWFKIKSIWLLKSIIYGIIVSLANYLGQSDQHYGLHVVDRNVKLEPVGAGLRDEFEDIMDREVNAMENIRDAFKLASFDAIFS